MGSPNRWSRRLSVLTAAFCLSLASERAQAQELTTTMAAAPPGFFGTLVYVAKEKGFFKDQGVRIDYFHFPGGARARDALIAGNVEFTDMVSAHVATARLKGRPLKIVGSLFNREFWTLVVRRDLQGRVKSVADLKGLTLGATTAGSGSHVHLARLVKQAGLDPDRDVKIVFVGELSTMYTALRAGKIDAMMGWQPAPVMAARDQAGYVLVDYTRPEEHARIMGAPESLAYIFATREEVIQNKPELVRRMVEALARAAAWVHENPADQVAAALQPEMKIEREVLVEALRQSLASIPKNASVSLRAYNSAMEPLVQAGILARLVPFEEAVDPRFAGKRP